MRRPREIARVRDRPRRRSPLAVRAGALAFASLCALATVGIVLLNKPGTGGGGEADATDAAPSVRAVDSRNHVTFRRTGRTLTIKIGRRARESLRTLSGSVRLECMHLGAGAVEHVYRRRLSWPEGSRFNSLTLPPRAAAATRECSLARGGRTLARASF